MLPHRRPRARRFVVLRSLRATMARWCPDGWREKRSMFQREPSDRFVSPGRTRLRCSHNAGDKVVPRARLSHRSLRVFVSVLARLGISGWPMDPSSQSSSPYRSSRWTVNESHLQLSRIGLRSCETGCPSIHQRVFPDRTRRT